MRHGEGERIEFKPFIMPGHEKENEVVETAIAFADTNGIIFVGVGNRCNVPGIEKGVGDLKSANGWSGLEDCVGWLRQLLADRVNADVSPQIEVVRHSGHTVVVIGIPEGSNKPYYRTQDNALFVRRGSNNITPNPDYEISGLYRSPGENEPA